MSKYSNDVNHYMMDLESSLEKALDFIRAVEIKPEYIKHSGMIFRSLLLPDDFKKELPVDLCRWIDSKI